jgi:polyhydroxyalkanoate synthase
LSRPRPATGPDPDAVGVPAGIEDLDSLGLVASLTRALAGSFFHPLKVSRAMVHYNLGLLATARALGAQLVHGGPGEGVMTPGPRDQRFEDVAWASNPMFFGLLQLYLLNVRLFEELVEVSDGNQPRSEKARFAAGLIADAAAPTNFLFSNPSALVRAFETGGRSVAKGLANLVDDAMNNNGWPKKVDSSAFHLGENLAATRGEVIYRNELIELIQYWPTTQTVHEIPLLMCPPWINRYYIMDLSPGRSLAEWAVTHGFSTFAISYRNPDSSFSDTTFDDYLLRGPLAALDVVRDVTGATQVNTVSVCLGGTLSVAMMAYLAEADEGDGIRSATLLNALTDHEAAGVLSRVFTDRKAVARIERHMARRGYLEAESLSNSFDLLRANDLVFRPLVSRWLLGEDPPAFDLLAWNAHPTRLPAAMHSFYLRHFWIDNELARDELELAGRRLVLSKIATETYIVGAVEDHIVPWTSSYRTTQLLSAPSRYVLTSSGHIAGIVNPPNPKARFWHNEANPPGAEEWREGATMVTDTWWNDWIAWLRLRSGGQQPPPSMGNDRHPVLCPAPGSYVRGD